jgi:hypothetical protein
MPSICPSRPLSSAQLLELASLVSFTGASYRAIALTMGLRSHECVCWICGGVQPLGCSGVCRGGPSIEERGAERARIRGSVR